MQACSCSEVFVIAPLSSLFIHGLETRKIEFVLVYIDINHSANKVKAAWIDLQKKVDMSKTVGPEPKISKYLTHLYKLSSMSPLFRCSEHFSISAPRSRIMAVTEKKYPLNQFKCPIIKTCRYLYAWLVITFCYDSEIFTDK